VPVNGVLSGPSYDENGNSLQPGNVVGSNNQLMSDASFTYTYDKEGHRVTRTAKAGVTGVPAYTEYAYDNRGRLVSVTDKTAATGGLNVQQVIYTYDGLNRKVGETVVAYNGSGTETGRVSTGFVYDGSQVLMELDSTGAVTRTNLWGPGTDHLMASDLGSGSSAVTVWPLFDEQGTIRDLYSLNGGSYQISQSKTFDEFGNVTGTANANAALAAFGVYYAGHELDSSTGLYDARARWYDPSTHQFITQDPSGFSAGDTNLYRYVGNDPANYTDPSGLQDVSISVRRATKPKEPVFAKVIFEAEPQRGVISAWGWGWKGGTVDTIGNAVAKAAAETLESEPVMSRVSGVGRIGSGAAVLTATVPEAATIVLIPVTIAGGVYAGDQFNTGLSEIFTGRFQQSHGSQLLHSVLGDGPIGQTAGLGYDVVPGGVAGLSSRVPLPPGSQYLKLSRSVPNSNVLRPFDFGVSTIAEDARHLRLWNDSMRTAASSPRENGYIRYLQALERGEAPTQEMLEQAFAAVNSRFLKSARAEGLDVAEVHHWNFGKSDFPTQIVDPRHLVPTPSRALHESIHRATSGSADIWAGPIDQLHEIQILEWSTPLAPRR
jgi:RHS repeat-associated protein